MAPMNFHIAGGGLKKPSPANMKSKRLTYNLTDKMGKNQWK
jgi:hypothetical protein